MNIVIDSDDELFLQRVKNVVEDHLSDTHFTIDQLAGEVAASPRKIRRKLRQLTNLSPAGFIRFMRMQRAAELLMAQAGSVSEIALMVGYRDSVSFSHVFQQIFGIYPSKYAGTTANESP